MKQIIKTGAAFAIVACWLVFSLFAALGVSAMSVDEEWRGWSDAVPLLLIYMILSGICATVVWFMVRTRT